MTHNIFLPHVTISQPSQSRPPATVAGNAWYNWSNDFTQLDRLKAYYYYNTYSFRDVRNGRAIPVIRPTPDDPSKPYHYRKICATLGAAYPGYGKVLNEPEQSTQDNINPIKAKLFTQHIAQLLPDMKQVGPNILASAAGWQWLDEYFGAGGRPFDVLGFHLYRQSGMEPGQAVDEFRRILAGHGYTRIPVFWVTEMGYPYTRPEAEEVMGRWVKACQAHVLITAVFGYTAFGGVPQRLDMILPDADGKPGQLSATGKAWVEAW
jgi:hypothetical protein